MSSWVTPSGTIVSVQLAAEGGVPNRDAVAVPVVVETSGGSRRETRVVFTTPGLNNVILDHQGKAPIDQAARQRLALLSVLRAVEDDPDFFAARYDIVVDGSALEDLEERHRISDGAIRRYIARKAYLLWSEQSFHALLEFSEVDLALTGTQPNDLLRNAQVLAQEGYIDLDETMGRGLGSFSLRATAKLIREVERYGAAREDVESAEEYARRLAAAPALSKHEDLLLLQRKRFAVAARPSEVVAVFRATAPSVEAVVRELLTASGDQRSYGSLGPMIGALKNRQIGDRSVWSQLTALQVSARDIDLHGGDLPESVLRIAVEICFEVVLQLGLLFPSSR